MEQQEPPEFLLDVFADPRSVHDVVKGILHAIFFHRFFPLRRPPDPRGSRYHPTPRR
ncbi:hypothetical protein FSOLCH5_002874 [Fusarium solani]